MIGGQRSLVATVPPAVPIPGGATPASFVIKAGKVGPRRESVAHLGRRNAAGRVRCRRELGATSGLRDTERATDLAGKRIRNLDVPRHGFDMACSGIRPQLVFFPLPLEETAVPSEVTK